MCASRVICCAGRNVTVTFCKLTAPADVVRRAEVRASARRPLDPNCASSSYQTRAGECRVVVCDPKAYTYTARGRKRREENKNTNKTKEPVRVGERVPTLNAICYVRNEHGEESANGLKTILFVFRPVPHPRVVPLTLPAPAQVIRRAEVRAESPFSTRSRTSVPREVENGERKTNLNQMEKTTRRGGWFSSLICVYQCEEFSQSRKL